MKPPCVVSFSGGRDSSALLSLAVTIARREGLDDPVPATLVFEGDAESDEADWQVLVLDHLGVKRDWVRLVFGDELDAVGPVARDEMRRHGLLWPFNLHFHRPIAELASGGSLITGFGGDELASTSSSLYAERLLARKKIRRVREVSVVGFRLAPVAVRFGIEIARNRSSYPGVDWLTSRGRMALRVADALETATVPMGWSRILRDWVWRLRYREICVGNFQVMASPFDVRMLHPFAEAPVLQALAASAPFAGLGHRTDLMRELFSDVLLPEVVGRKTKGAYSSPLWTATAIEFARSWSGRGIDETLVDPKRLRNAWLSDERTLLSTTLLQAAWLADNCPQ